MEYVIHILPKQSLGNMDLNSGHILLPSKMEVRIYGTGYLHLRWKSM